MTDIPMYKLLESNVPKKYYYTPGKKIYPILARSIVSPGVYQFRRSYVRHLKKGLCPALTASNGVGGHNVPLVYDTVGIRRITPRECFRLQGFPDLTIKYPCSDKQLYIQTGNSIPVTIVETILSEVYDL